MIKLQIYTRIIRDELLAKFELCQARKRREEKREREREREKCRLGASISSVCERMSEAMGCALNFHEKRNEPSK